MRFIRFPGYGVNGSDVNINAEKIESFYAIDYNGNHGTEIVTVDNRVYRTSLYVTDVRAELERGER